MRIELKSHINGKTLFAGHYSHLKACVEDAVAKGISLHGVDLSYANLACANLDNAKMISARLCGANLHGANLSESAFDHSDFSGAELSQVCFVASRLNNVNFTDASFSATDVTDALFSRCQFSCPSTLNCLFHRAELFRDCVYYCDKGVAHIMTRPPITIQGLPKDIVCMDHTIKIGAQFISKSDVWDMDLSCFKHLFDDQTAAFVIAAIQGTARNRNVRL